MSTRQTASLPTANEQTIADPPERSPASPRLHLGYIDGIRGIAALYVVLYHCYTTVNGVNGIPTGLAKTLTMPLNFGHQAVDIFIVLSGFCLILPALRSDYRLRGGFKTFLWKRARRILPPYYAAVALSLPVSLLLCEKLSSPPFVQGFPAITPLGVSAHIFLFQDVPFKVSEQINPALWSISVEWRIYLAMPVLLWLWRTHGPAAVLAASGIIAMVWFAMLSPLPIQLGMRENVGVMPHYFILFALGLVAGDVAYGNDPRLRNLRTGKIPFGVLSLVFLTLGIAAIKGSVRGQTLPPPVSDLLVGLAAASLFVCLAKSFRSPAHRFFSGRLLVFVGSFAYSIYLIHMAILRLVEGFFLSRWHPSYGATLWSLIMVMVPTTILVAYGFFALFERPFLSESAKKSLPTT